MLTFELIKERFSGVDGVDVTVIVAFIEKMKEARTSAFYNDELQAEYRALNVEDLSRIIDGGNRFSVRKNMLANRIRVTPNTFIPEVDYF